MTGQTMLIDYATTLATMMHSKTHALLVAHGKVCTPQKLPRCYRRGTVRECYRNAYNLAMMHNELQYVEGLALPDFMDIPIDHAWCIDDNGMVVDNTWPTVGKEYFGVPFDIKFVCNVIIDTGHFGAIAWHSETFRKRYGGIL